MRRVTIKTILPIRRILPLFLAGGMLLCGQTKAEMDRDEAEVMAYKLNLANLKKVVQGYRNLSEVLQSDPALAQRIREMNEKKETERTESTNGRIVITRAQRIMESEPKIAGAFQRAGTSVREAIVAPAALGLYAMANYSAQRGAAPNVPGLLQENLTFLQQNEAAIREIGTEMQKISKAMEVLTKRNKDTADADEAEEEAAAEEERR